MTEPQLSDAMRSFTESVRETAQLSSMEEAELLARATLRALSEGIAGGQAEELGRSLPPELGAEMSHRGGQARSVDKTSLLDQVSGELTNTDLGTTEVLVRAVLSTVAGWVPAKEIKDTVDHLPNPVATLFERPERA